MRYNDGVMARLFFCLLLFLALANAQDSAGSAPVPTKMEVKPLGTISGTHYWDIKVGTGKKAIPGFTLRVNYIGWFKKNKTDYVIFDSTVGKEPFQFDLGMRRVIKGWDEGIMGMRVGGRRQIIIPPEAAYGPTGAGKIPPNATLIFEVELVEVR